MSVQNHEIWDKLNGIISIVPRQYVDAIVTLDNRLQGKNVKWVIDGDLAETLKVVQVQSNCIEIVTSQMGAQEIFQATKEFNPSAITLQIQQLPRNALSQGKEYPVYVRSYYFTLNLKDVLVKVHGDLQFKVNNWGWGDIYDFDPDYIYVVGKKIAVTPLSVKAELYQSLGWKDRLLKIQQATQKPHHLKNG